MGEVPAAALQQNQPQGPPPYQPFPPQPISQYNLYNQQQKQQQQGYNANPYGVPYGNQRGGGAYNKICNPCCCCKSGNCNLRMNCIPIGIFLIIFGLCEIYYIASPLDLKTCYEVMYPDYERRGYKGRDDRIALYQEKCDSIRTIVLAMTVLSGLMTLFYVLAGAFLLVAVFRPRQGWAALASGILMPFCSVMTITFSVFHFVGITKYQDHIRNGTSTPIPIFFGTTLIAIVTVGLNIWFIVCAIQFWKQIKAGVDKDPVEGTPAQNIPPPSLTGDGHGPQPTLASSSATLPAPPPGDNAGSST